MAIHNASKRAAEAAEDKTVSTLSGVDCRLYIQHIVSFKGRLIAVKDGVAAVAVVDLDMLCTS
jgi:hypothetical protein